jgi:peptide/nickel transport system permease protein
MKNLWIAGPVLGALVALHVVVLLAAFFSPYDFSKQDRQMIYAPPTPIHFADAEGKFHLHPFVCRLVESSDDSGSFDEDRQHCFPIHLLAAGAEYRMLGIFHARRHLFGVDSPGRISLMGSDAYGRDIFSRFLYGGQASLFAGLLATALSLGLGVLLGTAAGFYGGWLDATLMRCVDLSLALPWLYLLFAIRAILPLSLDPIRAFLLIVAVVGIVGWARPARLIRGTVMSGKERHYVLAARMFGANDTYLIGRHILPQTYSIVVTQAVLLIPQYILAEVTLSFLGLGVGEPVPSWGNILAALQQYHVMVSYWWMWIPGVALIPIFLSFVVLGNNLRVNDA